MASHGGNQYLNGEIRLRGVHVCVLTTGGLLSPSGEIMVYQTLDVSYRHLSKVWIKQHH